MEVKDDLTFVAVNAKGDATLPNHGTKLVRGLHQPADKVSGALKRYFTFMVTDAQKMAPEITDGAAKTLGDKSACCRRQD